jgi:hypothetical protein
MMNRPTVNSTVTYRKLNGYQPQVERIPTVSSTVRPTVSSTDSVRKLNGDHPLSLRCRVFLSMFFQNVVNLSGCCAGCCSLCHAPSGGVPPRLASAGCLSDLQQQHLKRLGT